MAKAKQKKPSPELQAAQDLLRGLAADQRLMVWDGGAVKVVKKIRLMHSSDGVAKAFALDV